MIVGTLIHYSYEQTMRELVYCTALHRGGTFFKERRYLLAEFPCLLRDNLTVLEVGCGSGSSALPVLRANGSARQGLTLVHFSAQPEPFLSRTD